MRFILLTVFFPMSPRSPLHQACVSRTPSSQLRGKGNDKELPTHASRETLWPSQASVPLVKAHGSIAATKGNDVTDEDQWQMNALWRDVEGCVSACECGCACEWVRVGTVARVVQFLPSCSKLSYIVKFCRMYISDWGIDYGYSLEKTFDWTAGLIEQANRAQCFHICQGK